MAEWLEVVVPTSVAAADEVAAELIEGVAAAKAGTQLRKDEVVFWVDVEGAEVALDQTRQLVRGLAERGLPVCADDVRTQAAAREEDWRDAWKRYFKATRLSRQIVVVPSWESYACAEGDVCIDLDPGQAFGTGAHATTQLVIAALQEACDAGRRVERFFDVGCGSGILSIVASRLWPNATGVAADVDPLAVDASRENLGRNAVLDRVDVVQGSADAVAGSFDLVLANIQAHVLLAIADDLVARLAPGGMLILSGLLSSQGRSVAETYVGDHGLVLADLSESSRDPEWTCAVLSRS